MVICLVVKIKQFLVVICLVVKIKEFLVVISLVVIAILNLCALNRCIYTSSSDGNYNIFN